MKKSVLAALSTVVLIALPSIASAQGVVRGAREGSEEGAAAAGPVGGLVGGVVGGVTGGVAGLLGVDQRHHFHDYVESRHYRSYDYRGPVAVGTVLPPAVTYYDVPEEYHLSRYRYAVVDGQTVLVDPATHRIVEIVD